MLEINKQYLVDDRNQANGGSSIAEFEQIEEILENFGLAKLMSEASGDDNERLSKDEALKYYRSLKENHVEN